VTLITRVRVGPKVLDFRATGDNLVDAYAALTHGIASQSKGASSATDP
jgi:hypothetical protein